ncbi:unnamed protein product [Hermetia illucens]|uniref:Uncharacterized protein n=1 Tax=Hermetia illucens TaxID=343691 RepID=A0A7R8UJ73_HERIL|nr:unnamed protein product [Hermetia illucens]
MKFAVVILALVAIVAADVSHLESNSADQSVSVGQPEQSGQQNQEQLSDLSPAASSFNPSVNREYLPPQARASDPAPAHTFGADGYRYKEPENKFFF